MTKVALGSYNKPKQRRPRPADWGMGMTVCIGAFASFGHAIIGVSDQMIGAGTTTAELPYFWKTSRISEFWFAMVSGDDISQAPRIIREVAQTLHDSGETDVDSVTDTFISVYQKARERAVEQSVLSAIGLSMAEYRSMLTTDSGELGDIKRRVERFVFDCEFLVIGFDPQKHPHIFTVSDPGKEHHYDNIGFWSIGAGSDAALSNLFLRRLNSTMSLEEMVYLIAEAKFRAETAMGVGKNTVLWIVREDGQRASLTHAMLDIRQIWEQEGQTPIPEKLEERIEIAFSQIRRYLPPNASPSSAAASTSPESKVWGSEGPAEDDAEDNDDDDE